MKVVVGRGRNRLVYEIASGKGNTQEANALNAKTICDYKGIK